MKARRHKNFSARLLEWFRRHRRSLPWRETRDPYRVWLSEVMLQQTRAAVVIPYYLRFLERYPDMSALARSADPELLECWSGLGYYSRARNLRRAAQHIIAELSGTFPRTAEQWLALPGVGPYTAAAVASIAFQEPVAVLDGNVARVMARWKAHQGDIRLPRVRGELRGEAQALLDRRHPGDYNQALMELGATVCLPRNPRCASCPISGDCEARRLGVQDQLPIKLVRRKQVDIKMSVAIVRRNGKILLRQRSRDQTLMPGFWELPPADLFSGTPGKPLATFRHTITHHLYAVSVFRPNSPRRLAKGCRWVGLGELSSLPLTTITRKALRTV